MYLVELDKNGLIKDDKSGTGWFAIKAFKTIYDKWGKEGMTVIALTKDYLSSMRNYPEEEERFIRAQEFIYDSRKKLSYEDPDIRAALKIYGELQWHPDMEQERIYHEIKARYLRKLAEANMKNDDAEIMQINKSLIQHEGAVAKFKERFKKSDIIRDSSVTEGGYHLTRIERDLEENKKKSRFIQHGKNLENPEKLNIKN